MKNPYLGLKPQAIRLRPFRARGAGFLIILPLVYVNPRLSRYLCSGLGPAIVIGSRRKGLGSREAGQS